MSDTANQILDAAETMMREGGYHAFSFREIASQLSIKSASVHYHFPTKEGLGNAVAQRYISNFLEAIDEPTKHEEPIAHYISVFRQAQETDGRACLCGILAAEAGRLPDSMLETLKDFNAKNVRWLEDALSKTKAWPEERCHEMATVVFAALEGAMIFACLNAKPDHLVSVGDSLKKLLAA